MTTSLSFRNCSEAYCKGEPPWCLTAVITRFLSFFSFSAKKLSASRLLLTASVIIFLFFLNFSDPNSKAASPKCFAAANTICSSCLSSSLKNSRQ